MESHSQEEVDARLSIYGPIGDRKIMGMDELAAAIRASADRAVSIRLWIHMDLQDSVRRILEKAT